MKYLCSGFLLLMFILIPSSLVLGQVDFAITSPEAGSAVQGKVEIKGYIKATDFAGYELDFSNASSSGAGWFPIQTSDSFQSEIIWGPAPSIAAYVSDTVV